MNKSNGYKILKYLYKYYPDQESVPIYHVLSKVKKEPGELKGEVLSSLVSKKYALFGGGWEKLGMILNPTLSDRDGLQTLDKYPGITGCLQKEGYEFVRDHKKENTKIILWVLGIILSFMGGYCIAYFNAQ